ncbi:hypothetical protein SAMN04487948_1279 [Halogranum amylolyticum]|uniref:Uncharacterized protein n=1 Tax=Halogranum amylolyticum TaxID=660520 RepID=A0A1H8WC67_9EURY|nr:hypothetical protein [Halogranum amylolyticum]SEP25221.1 hypothetical protein SAMN04487948_1279 [Halogranum amylolyticum]
MVSGKGVGGAVLSLVLILVVVGTAFDYPILAEIALESAPLFGVEIIRPTGMLADFADLAQTKGPAGFVGTFAFSFGATLAIGKSSQRVWNRIS